MRHKNGSSILARMLAAALVVAAAAACSGTQHAPKSGDSAAASVRPSFPSASPSPSSELLPSPWATASGTAAQRAAAQAALTAYDGMWNTLVKLGRTSDWKNPHLGEFMLYQPLTNWSSAFEEDKSKGIVTLGPLSWRPETVSVLPAEHPTRVVISDCLDATKWLRYYAKTGKLIDNVPGGRHRTDAVVTFDDVWQRWVVTQQIIRKAGTC